jgi:hypothetical protein
MRQIMQCCHWRDIRDVAMSNPVLPIIAQNYSWLVILIHTLRTDSHCSRSILSCISSRRCTWSSIIAHSRASSLICTCIHVYSFIIASICLLSYILAYRHCCSCILMHPRSSESLDIAIQRCSHHCIVSHPFTSLHILYLHILTPHYTLLTWFHIVSHPFLCTHIIAYTHPC